jgi:hypothetical protein
MVLAHLAHDETEAETLSQVLDAAGIDNFVVTESTGLPLPLSKRGSVQLMVMEPDVEQARAVIAEFLAGHSEPSPEE